MLSGMQSLILLVRDHEMKLTSKLQFPDPTQDGMNIPLDTPAFWLAHRKKYLYCDGFIQKSHRTIMQFSFAHSLTGKKIRGWEDDYKSVLAWIESVRAPKFSGTINAKLAEDGSKVFNTHCARCHGKYGAEKSYPERLIGIKVVGTDAVRSTLSLDFKKHLGRGWIGDYGKVKLQLRTAYVPPPLDGVWATAPYLHNGSVPTLWHMLNPDERPAVWLRTEDGYDRKRLGLEVKEFDTLPDSAKTLQERRLYYQTQLRGLSNEGTAFREKVSLKTRLARFWSTSRHSDSTCSTRPSQRVPAFRFDGPQKWVNIGRLGTEKEVMGMAVYNGKLYAGTLPLAEIYRYDGKNKWVTTGQLDKTPDVRYRRAWVTAVFDGKLYCGVLPSGHVHSLEAGKSVTYDRALPPGWHHLVAVKADDVLRLYIDGKQVAQSTKFDPAKYDLNTKSPLKIGFGQHDYFNGKMKDLRIYDRELSPREIERVRSAAK